MKKILLTAFALLLVGYANAQVGGTPRELTCTEEAFTFKANIGSGWHLSQFSMGPPETAKIVIAYTPTTGFKPDGASQKPQAASLTSELLTTQVQHVTNRYMPVNFAVQNSGKFQFDKLYYLVPYSPDFWLANNLNISKSGFNMF
jgi:hypothetical protein